ncbi:uncharacterized protein LOC5575170 [Aedes aegypti]|uniref:Uncharacterized protein n=1 Tax=Aedes aegypti TaxID=7159 RepID=A0A1S4EVH7_AEDAE|nr:uncharacterized protein LOC5575170 [Aedes aegypti]
MNLFPGVVPILVTVMILGIDAVKPSSNVDFTDVEDPADDSGFVNVYRNYPKIQVTVDTSKLKRVSQAESEDSSSGSSGSSGSESVERPTIGVKTDITIEISEESVNETNTVDGKIDTGKRVGSNGKKNGKSDDDDNASVPVFKGMAGVPTKGKTPKPTSSNDVNGKRPGVTLSSRPTTFVHNSDDRRPSGPHDGWNRYQPLTGVWTTERPYIRRIEYDYYGNPIYVKSYVPYHQTQQGHQQDSSGNWKPCYCSPNYPQPWDRAPSNPVLPTPTHRRKVDDKVDIPYKQHRD